MELLLGEKPHELVNHFYATLARLGLGRNLAAGLQGRASGPGWGLAQAGQTTRGLESHWKLAGMKQLAPPWSAPGHLPPEKPSV